MRPGEKVTEMLAKSATEDLHVGKDQKEFPTASIILDGLSNKERQDTVSAANKLFEDEGKKQRLAIVEKDGFPDLIINDGKQSKVVLNGKQEADEARKRQMSQTGNKEQVQKLIDQS